jgi:hypothetical protein
MYIYISLFYLFPLCHIYGFQKLMSGQVTELHAFFITCIKFQTFSFSESQHTANFRAVGNVIFCMCLLTVCSKYFRFYAFKMAYNFLVL